MTPRQFAREAMRNGLPLTAAGPLRIGPHWTELVLYRDGPRQIELVVLHPHAQVPPHRHLRCDSADVALAGGGEVRVEGRAFPFGLGPILSVPVGVVHSGCAGPDGAAYLSFQIWQGEPTYIASDWEAA
jgi:quercetin dioxygenase-like cupin family protein